MYSPEKRATRYVPDELVLHERFLVGPLPSSALHDVFSAWQTDSNADPPVFERVYFERSKKQNEKKSADYRPLSLNNHGLVAGQIPFDIFYFSSSILAVWSRVRENHQVLERFLVNQRRRRINIKDRSKRVRHVYQDGTATFTFIFCEFSFFFFSCRRLKNSPWVSRVEKRNDI